MTPIYIKAGTYTSNVFAGSLEEKAREYRRMAQEAFIKDHNRFTGHKHETLEGVDFCYITQVFGLHE